MHIRRMSEGDMYECLEIAQQAHGLADQSIILQCLNDMFSTCSIRPMYFVATEDNKVVAFVGLAPSWMSERVFEVTWLTVAKSHQRRGIGTALMEYVIRRVKADVPSGMLQVMADESTGCPAFYQRFGFTTQAVVPYLATDAHLMLLQIPSPVPR